MKNRNQTTTASGGIGATGLLGIAFIVLKLCGVIDWPWWWVLSPYWITFGVALLVLLITLVIALVKASRK